MWILKFFLILFVVVLGTALALMNAGPVHFDYYFGSVDTPLSLILVGALGSGGLLGVAVSFMLLLNTRKENTRLRRKAHLAEQEVSNLRTLPLQDR